MVLQIRGKSVMITPWQSQETETITYPVYFWIRNFLGHRDIDRKHTQLAVNIGIFHKPCDQFHQNLK